MTIRERILEGMKTAMKAKDRDRLETLRMIKSRIQEAEVSLRSEKGLDYQLEDEQTIAVLSRYAKQRRDSIESYRQAGREDLASREEGELKVVQEYLPRQLTPEEIREIIRAAIEDTGADSPKQMGAVMKIVAPKTRGMADGKQVSEMVREMLS